MEIRFTFGPAKKTSGAVSLNKMISRLLYSFQPAAVRKNSFFVNDVPIDFVVNTHKDMLAAIISELFTSVIYKTKNSCIHISAKRYSDIILFRVHDSHANSTTNFEYNWREINPLVEKLGGCITINESRNTLSVITLSFRSLTNAA